MSRNALLTQKIAGLGEIRKSPKQYNRGTSYQVKTTLPADSDVAGFSRGMDDLGQILLNQKKEVKFNRNLITAAGADYWVSKKNEKLKPGKAPWTYAETDINKDGVPEVVIFDGDGNIRYINGYHLGKSKHKFNYAYQSFIDDYGYPMERQVKKALNEIKPKELSQTNFRYQNTMVDDANPDGPLIATGYLAKAGYQPKAPSACNLLLSYYTKFAYKALVEGKLFPSDVARQKAFKQIYGVVRANADIYKQFVTEYVNEYFKSRGIPEKEAKKRYDKSISEYSKLSLQRVHDICANKDKIKEQANQALLNNLNAYKTQFFDGKQLATKEDFPLNNPRKYQENSTPNIERYINRYGIRTQLTTDAEKERQAKQARVAEINRQNLAKARANAGYRSAKLNLPPDFNPKNPQNNNVNDESEPEVI